ncbi:unnamed protein product, partial [Porites evermanni]
MVSVPVTTFLYLHILTYSNSFVNPIIYALKIPEFRQSLITVSASEPGLSNTLQAVTPCRKLKRRSKILTSCYLTLVSYLPYAILHTCCSCLLKFHFNKDRCIYFAILISIFLSVLCCCNIVIWRKFQQRGNAIHQQNRAYQNQRLTKTLLFVSAASLFSWLPYAVVKYLRVAHEIPFPVTCLYCTYILNYFNSFASPIIYVSTI